MENEKLKEGVRKYLKERKGSLSRRTAGLYKKIAQDIYDFLDKGGSIDKNNIMQAIPQIGLAIRQTPLTIHIIRKGFEMAEESEKATEIQGGNGKLTPDFFNGALTILAAIESYTSKLKQVLESGQKTCK